MRHSGALVRIDKMVHFVERLPGRTLALAANGNRFFDGVRQVPLDPVVSFLAVGACRVITLYD